MAQLALKLSDNIDGEFFVDSTCIDCDACRQIAPTVFHDIGDQSAVYHQPETDDELLAAQKALISCPTASIGTASRHDMTRALASLPEHVDEDVYRCGSPRNRHSARSAISSRRRAGTSSSTRPASPARS
ncbi:MAG TPA: ferredoxin [Thermoanaerobaculia bacterium]